MADKKQADKKPAKRVLKKPPTVREQAKQKQDAKPKKRIIRGGAKHVARPFKAAAKVGKKEYYIPMPDNKAGKFLNKKRRVTPSYFVEAWRELKLVTWPNRKETAKLTFAVIIFAFVFGVIVAVVDYGLDKVFRSLLLK